MYTNHKVASKSLIKPFYVKWHVMAGNRELSSLESRDIVLDEEWLNFLEKHVGKINI